MKKTNNNTTAQTVAILYGFCEGKRVAHRFIALLNEVGYQIIDDPTVADIIIGHSGGCFLLPDNMNAKKIIQIGIPYWPGRSVASSIARKFATDIHSHHKEGALTFWLHKTSWNAVYFWNMRNNFRMLRGRARGHLWTQGKITTVVRPSFDTLCISDLSLLPYILKPKLVTVPGHHDEIWHNPKPYIKIVQS